MITVKKILIIAYKTSRDVGRSVSIRIVSCFIAGSSEMVKR